jgi:hypothetical protein
MDRTALGCPGRRPTVRSLLIKSALVLGILCLLPLQLPAQQISKSAIGDAAKQKRRSARFLAQRGIGRPGTLSPAASLAAARAQYQRLQSHAIARIANSAATPLTAPWQPMGPPQVSTTAYGLVTGRVTSIAADPSDTTGNTVYVGSTGGGVWKSTNAAASVPASVSFIPLTDTPGAFPGVPSVSLSIGALSVQPGGTGVILAGTGDPNDATDSYYGSGILRSADSGVTWTLITQTKDTAAGTGAHFTFLGSSFAGFAWSTTTPGLVVAAVSSAAEGTVANAGQESSNIRGLYYSQDAGQTWSLAAISDGPNSLIQSDQTPFSGRGNAATSVVWNPVRQMFYAAVQNHGYYQSPDGANWTRLANQPGVNLTPLYCPTNQGSIGSPACPIFRGVLAVQAVTGDLFALTVDENNLDQGLFQDVCGLVSGSCSSPTVNFANQIGDTALEAGGGDTAIPQADYDLYLSAVPSQQDTLLFAGTSDIFKCSLANSCAWRNTTHSNTCDSAQVAPAQHALDATFASLRILYFGNDGGLWRSTDLVNQQAAQCSPDDANHFQNLNQGLGSLAEVESIGQDAGNAQNMMASLGALGTAAPQGAVNTWTQVLDGEGNNSAIDPAAEENWYATSEFGVSISRCTEGSGCNIAGFEQPVIGNTQVDGDGNQQTIPAPWILDPQDTSNIVLGTCRVWRGPATGGSSWSSANLLSPMLDGDQGQYCNGNAEIRTLAASGSATDAAGTPERIYAGMAGLLDGGATVPGHVFTASVAGTPSQMPVWTDLFHSPVANSGSATGEFNPGGFDISSIFVDPHDPTGQTVYVTVQGFSGNGLSSPLVYGSVDGGADWSNITSNLTNSPANSIVVDPNDANTVYVATDTGVWVTTDVASCANPYDNCWTPFGTSLPNAPPVQLAAFNEGSTSVLRVATYGRGIWQIPLVTAGTVRTTASATPSSLTFPAQQVQTQSAPQQVLVKNTGSITLTITGLTTAGDFAEIDTCTSPIAPGDACTVDVTFLPTQTGARTGLLTVFANLPGGQITVSLSGTGLAAASVVLNPTQLTFPATLLGATAAAQNITISNTGGATASLTSETATGDFAVTANTCASTLNANTGCTIAIAFTPSVAGARSGTLTVIDSAGTQTAQLTGIGLAPATDLLSPTSLTYPPQVIGSQSSAQQVTLTNNGDQALQLIATQTTGEFNAVNDCGTSLAGHSSCAILIQFVPTITGLQQGTLTVSDALHAQTVSLSGTGLAPAGISATPAMLNFGDYAVGGSSPPLPVTLTDNGGVALSNLKYQVSGNFTLSSNPGGCGATLAAGANCQLAIVFSPQQAGSLSGTLIITADGLAAPLQVALSGSGEDFTMQVSGSSSATVTSGQAASFQLQIQPLDASTGTVALVCTGAPQYSTCGINPATVTLSGAGPSFATISVATGQSTVNSARRMRQDIWPRTGWLALLAPLGLAALRRKRWPSALFLLAAVTLLFPAGCGLGVTPGSGASGSTSTSSPVNSTPSGVYTVTVTGTAPGLSHSAQVTLTVE